MVKSLAWTAKIDEGSDTFKSIVDTAKKHARAQSQLGVIYLALESVELIKNSY